MNENRGSNLKLLDVVYQQIKTNGKDVLRHHLGHLMDASIDDPDWKVLKEVLLYLTCTENIGRKTVEGALQILQGRCLISTIQMIFRDLRSFSCC
jgi:hypothetical protein